MKVIQTTIASSLFLVLSACSDGDSTSVLQDNMPVDDATDIIDVNNYRTKLSGALDLLRGSYFEPFIQAPASANQLFQQPLPDAHEFFGFEPYPTGIESTSCDSGSVTRDVFSSDSSTLTILARFDFADCVLSSRVINGSVEVELDGDTPSRLGGQSSRVVLTFTDMEIKTGSSLDRVSELTGTYSTNSGWGAAYLEYSHVYNTESYRETLNSTNDQGNMGITIANASYIQKLESDYFESENVNTYYRLSESGSLTAVETQNQIPVEYTISIDPVLLYASQLDVNNQPVYSDDVLSGEVSYVQIPTGSITVVPSQSEAGLMTYSVGDGLQSVSEVDVWLYPIDCDDNSAMNTRDLCDARR